MKRSTQFRATTKIIRAQGNIEKPCPMHYMSRIFDGISAQVLEQVRIQITDSYKKIVTLFGINLLWYEVNELRTAKNPKITKGPKHLLVAQFNLDSNIVNKNTKTYAEKNKN